jgi:hypothetical protein
MNRFRPASGGIARTVFTLAALAACSHLRADLSAAGTDGTVLYETGFEPFEGFSPSEDLIGQGSWIGYASDLQGNSAPAGGNGVLADPVPGFTGQYAYIGFVAPNATADFNVWRPINLKPVGQPLPVVRVRVSLQINDSTQAATFYDAFRWSIYNTADHRFLSVDFDNADHSVNFILDDETATQPPAIRPTGFTFDNGVPYDLELDLNYQRNLWTARINGTVLVNAQPITSVGAALTFGDADAVWVIGTPGKPGDNYMIFDDFRISVLPLGDIPPTVEPVGMLNTGAFVVRIIGEPGVTYRLEATADLNAGSTAWQPVATGVAQSPGGYVDLQDTAAGVNPLRLYRAVSLP